MSRVVYVYPVEKISCDDIIIKIDEKSFYNNDNVEVKRTIIKTLIDFKGSDNEDDYTLLNIHLSNILIDFIEYENDICKVWFNSEQIPDIIDKIIKKIEKEVKNYYKNSEDIEFILPEINSSEELENKTVEKMKYICLSSVPPFLPKQKTRFEIMNVSGNKKEYFSGVNVIESSYNTRNKKYSIDQRFKKNISIISKELQSCDIKDPYYGNFIISFVCRCIDKKTNQHKIELECKNISISNSKPLLRNNLNVGIRGTFDE